MRLILLICFLVLSFTSSIAQNGTDSTTNTRIAVPPPPPPPPLPVNLENIKYWEEKGEFIKAYNLLDDYLNRYANKPGLEQQTWNHYLKQMYGDNYLNDVKRKIRQLKRKAKKQAEEFNNHLKPKLNGRWRMLYRTTENKEGRIISRLNNISLAPQSIIYQNNGDTSVIRFNLDKSNFSLSENSFTLKAENDKTTDIEIKPLESFNYFNTMEEKAFEITGPMLILKEKNKFGLRIVSHYVLDNHQSILEVGNMDYHAWLKKYIFSQ